MFSRVSLRKSSRVLLACNKNQRLTIARTFFNQSQGSTSPSSLRSSFGDQKSTTGDTLLKLFRSLSSGILVAGSLSFGFLYWFSNSTTNTFLSFADSPRETWPADGDQLRHSIPKKNSKFLFGDAYRRRVFFNYEKRMRMQSPPEKLKTCQTLENFKEMDPNITWCEFDIKLVFEYFASFRTPAGDVLMTPADLMRAIVPVFSPSESSRVREGFLRGERVPGELHCAPSKFFMLFDTNSDGLISFPEYIFFVTLLSIPESSFSVAFKMFDLNNNGEIDRDEFKKVMGLMRSQSRQGAHHRGGRRAGFKLAESVENGGLVEYFFGKDGKTCLQHERFVQFLRDLHDEILKLEFCHYDCKLSGTISAKDFALSLVASADISHINKLLDRVDELNNEPHLRDIRISFQEFKDFAELRKKLQSLSLAIFTYGRVNGVLTKKDFQRAASQVCGISITNNLVDIIFHVFDANRDGSLSSDEFVRVLQRRETDTTLPREGGIKGLISCWKNCATNCSSAKLLL